MSTRRDSGRRQMSRTTVRQMAPHLESYVSSRTGDPIHVGCVCPIGRPHSYEEWQSQAAPVAAVRRPRRASTDAS